MLDLILFILLLGHNEVLVNIKNLGNDRFLIREEANTRLFELLNGKKRLLTLSLLWTARRYKDPEINRRIEGLEDWYYGVMPFDEKGNTVYPSIWYMTNEERFPCGLNGPDISLIYYKKAIVLYNIGREKEKKELIPDNFYSHHEIGNLASVLFYRDLLKLGVKREDVKKKLETITENNSNWYHQYFYTSPPGPLIKRDPTQENYPPPDCD